MKVLIVNTSEKTGGAAVAASRLMEALNNYGVKAKMLVTEKETDHLTVIGLPQTPWLRWHFLWERLVIWFHCHASRKHLFEIDIANTGTDITKMHEFWEADVIHLHWINQGMLSLKVLRKILLSGKPVVWTMHDMWPATAICHYTRGCDHYQTECCHCHLLPGNGSDKDLASSIWKEKKDVLGSREVAFVACSQWLRNEAAKSALIQKQHIIDIPNAIDTHTFQPIDKKKAREEEGLPTDKRLILFVSQRVTDERKGMRYFVEAVNKLADTYPAMKGTTGVAILGGHAEEIESMLKLPVYPLGYVNNEQRIVHIYNTADVFVLPSLEDNLPNTLMEAMACGVPCVGFNVGGIPEMIDHQQNGFVAKERDADELAKGIHWVLEEGNYEQLQQQCLHKVKTCYSQQHVAHRYIELYEQLLAKAKKYE